MVSIIIADQHALCREALCDYIRHAGEDYSIQGVGDYNALREGIVHFNPDIVLINQDLPGMEEREIGKDLLIGASGVKLGIMVSSIHGIGAMEPHIRGVFPKTLPCKAFIEGIEEIMSGRPHYPHIKMDYNEQIVAMPSRRVAAQDFNLTAREREVLTYLLKGASNKDIARALDLQVVTVKLHVRGICRKMKAGNRTQAALIAKENGWD